MFRIHHVLLFVTVLYISYCFAADSKNSDIAVKSACPTCKQLIGTYCAFKTEHFFGGNCPKFSMKFFPPSNVIDCPQVHISCRAACEKHDAIMHIAPRHGANITVRAEKAVQLVGYCTGDNTWSVKDVRTNIVYSDIIHAECQKLYENTPRYQEEPFRMGVSSTGSQYGFELGPDTTERVVNDMIGLTSLFDIIGSFVRRC
uniref:Uncharacterized protein n=1 Tax=Panagrellus redivivus TaxID=6233 RepID=A0A7E4VVH6_PANRE